MRRSDPHVETAASLFERNLHLLAREKTVARLAHARPRIVIGRPSRKETPLRAHTTIGYEIALVTEGQARIVTPGETFDLVPGRPLLIDPGVDHGEYPADPPCPFVMFWCLMENTYARLDQTSYTDAGTYRPGPAVELPGRTNIESIADAVSAELENQDWGWQRSVYHMLGYLTCLLIRRVRRGNMLRLRQQESPTISAEPRAWGVIHAALQFCDANFRRPLRVYDIAKAVGYSPNYLSHVFSTHLGRSITDHIRELRLNVARDLLENTELSVSEISRTVGYADPAHFTRAFTRAAQCSPKAYRERLRGL